MSGYQTDGESHWQVCGCGVVIENSRAAHTDGDNDGQCDICSYSLPENEPSGGEATQPSADDGEDSFYILWIILAIILAIALGVAAAFIVAKKKKE